ncbi:MAG: M23 family metallopeptidase, partial [Erysipelotrichales bacterium]
MKKFLSFMYITILAVLFVYNIDISATTDNDGSYVIKQNESAFNKDIRTSFVAPDKFKKPVTNNAILTCGYGTTCAYYANQGKFHTGVDLGYKFSTNKSERKILASASGKVESVINSNVGYGKHIKFCKHDNAYKTLYGHMSSFKVSKGDIVYTGQVIGMEGSTGNAKGDHLHFEIWKNGDYKHQPVNYMANRKTATPLASDTFITSYYKSGRKKQSITFSNGKQSVKTLFVDNSANNVSSKHQYESTGNYWKKSMYYKNGILDYTMIQPGTAANPILEKHYYDSTGKHWEKSMYYKSGILDYTMIQPGTAANPVLEKHFYDVTGKYWTTSYYYKDGKTYRKLTQPGTITNHIIQDEYYFYNGKLDYVIEYSNGKAYKVKYHNINGEYVKEEYYAAQNDWVVKFKHENGHEYYIGYQIGEATATGSEFKMKLSSDRPFFYKYDKYTNRLEQPSGTIKKGEILDFSEWTNESNKIIPIYSANEYKYVMNFTHNDNGITYYIGYKLGEATEAGGTNKMKLSNNRNFFYRYDSETKKFIQGSG